MAPSISRREVASTCAGWGSLPEPGVGILGVPLRHYHFYRGGKGVRAGIPGPTAVPCGSTGRDVPAGWRMPIGRSAGANATASEAESGPIDWAEATHASTWS